MFDPIAHRTSAAGRSGLTLVEAGAPPFAAAGPSPAEAYDATLLAAVAAQGDEAAFEELYRRHYRAVASVALQVCRNSHAAEDVAAHTFTALWSRAGRLVARSVRLRAWLTTVARNAAIDYVRSAATTVAAIDEAAEQPACEPGPEATALARESSVALHAAIAQLSSDQRTVIEMIYFGAMTYAAVADATGEPLGTLKSRVRLALGHLRTRLAAGPVR